MRDQVVIITGASRGIGRATAMTLAEAGAHIVAVARSQDGLSQTRSLIESSGGRCTTATVDVGSYEEITELVTSIKSDFGRIDVLINNAGTAKRMPSEDMPLDAWQRVIDVNLTGVFLCAREAGKHMLDAGRGSVVNLASIMGHVGGALYGNIAYHASKGAVVNLTRALAVEWGARGVRVNAIAPTFVETPFTENLLSDPAMRSAIEAATPMGRIARVDDLAGAFLYLSSPASALVTGHSLAVDGGWLAR